MTGSSISFLMWVALLLLATLSSVQAQCGGTSRRRPWRSLSCAEQDAFLSAVQALKDSGDYDDIAWVHWSTGGAAHQVPAFLPWHRYYLWIFERQLQRVSGTCVTVPFWDWERDGSIPTVFRSNTFGSENGGCVRDGIGVNWETNNGCLTREFDRRWSFSRDVEVLSRITNSPNFEDFSVELEGAPHASVHQFVGGTMSNNFSPHDPLFWIHHCNVDRIWTLWQNYHGHHIVDPDDYEREHYHANLDTPIRVDGDRGDFFGRPTPRQLLSNRGIVNVQYEDDNLARNLVQTSGRFAAEINEGWNVPVRAGERCNGNNNLGGGGGGGDVDTGGNGNQQQQQQQCRDLLEPCNRNGLCCSGRCVEGSCWDESVGNSRGNPDDNDNDGNQQQQQQQCRNLLEQCNGNGQCCSFRCRQGECWDPSVDTNEDGNDGDNQQPTCDRGQVGQRCRLNRHCCSGLCQGGRCRSQNNGSDNEDNQQPQQAQEPERMCARVTEPCSSGADCCSRRCGGGTCRRRTNIRRRAATTRQYYWEGEASPGNDYWQTSAPKVDLGEPIFSSPELDTRWHELMELYNGTRPDLIFEILGREDCDNRTLAANHTIESASPEWIQSRHLPHELEHVFDCHYVIVHNNETEASESLWYAH